MAVILEPVQGEGGIHVATPAFLQGLRKLTLQHKALLILDEVQTGFGRTGKMFAYQHYGIQPDMLCMAKSIAGGVPMGATLLASKYTDLLPPGTHASTFGGNYLAAAAGLAVMKTFEREKILIKMKPKEKVFTHFFKEMMQTYPAILAYRHLGFMFGLQMKPGYAVACTARAWENGLIINCTAGTVLRIMPALNITTRDLRFGLQVLREVFADVLGT